MLKRKPEALVRLYRTLEKKLKSLKGVEIVAKDRYALFRTTRVFADLVFMKDALRLAILLDRKIRDPMFFKVGKLSTHRIGHVALLRNRDDLRAVEPYLLEAYRFARSDRGEVT